MAYGGGGARGLALGPRLYLGHFRFSCSRWASKVVQRSIAKPRGVRTSAVEYNLDTAFLGIFLLSDRAVDEPRTTTRPAFALSCEARVRGYRC